MKAFPNASKALLTDYYQLTMAQGYWELGMAEHEAIFQLFFRENPFEGGYTLLCGLAQLIEYVQDFSFSNIDLEYLATEEDALGKRLFKDDFIAYLKNLELTCDIDAMPEGSIAFPNQPILRVKAPLIQAQILETALLNHLNFPTLIATKASRICAAAQGDPVIEFGVRRAQGPDGGLTASRAAYVGGCTSTSNVWAAARYGFPAKGTHSHSWVMSFDDELESFRAFAKAMPNNCVLLVDTYDTTAAVDKAVKVGLEMAQRGEKLLGIRLDSGDLITLSKMARVKLDKANLQDVQLLGSNDLDEYQIAEHKAQGGQCSLWGVGTRLATAYDQPALGGVYKLVAIQNAAGQWRHKMKSTDDPDKASVPGPQQVRRYYQNGKMVGDVLYHIDRPLPSGTVSATSLTGDTRQFDNTVEPQDMLVPIFENGKAVYISPNIDDIRQHAADSLAQLPPKISAIHPTETYYCGLEITLFEERERDYAAMKKGAQDGE